MPALSKDEAVARLSKAIGEADVYDVVEIYHELFPEKRVSKNDAYKDVAPLFKEIVDHVSKGLEVEEILDLWPVVFTQEHDAHYDEETEAICYEEGPEPLVLAE